ncbi:MAG: hypothetical protein KBF23_05855 [Agitococcus sp.]|nr:hypothetical protein [Agitococcus sp.]
MKKLAIIVGLTLSASLVSQTTMAFGLPKMPSLGSAASSEPSQAVDVDGFIKKASDTNMMFQQSALLLASYLGEKSTVATLNTKLQAIQTIPDPKERSAQTKALYVEQESVIKAALEDKTKAKEQLSQAQGEQLAKIINAAFNFALGVIQAKELVPAGQSAITSIQSNPMQATKLVGLKNTVSDLTGIVGSSVTALTTVPSLFKEAKIDAPIPTSTTDKPREFKD